jgi:hypothetical protein
LDERYLVTEKLDGVSKTLYVVRRDSKWIKAVPRVEMAEGVVRQWLLQRKTEGGLATDGPLELYGDYFLGVATQKSSVLPCFESLEQSGVSAPTPNTSIAWDAVSAMNLHERLLQLARSLEIGDLALQGELIGPEIRPKTASALTDQHAFFAYGLWDIDRQPHLPVQQEIEVLEQWGLPRVPIVVVKSLKEFLAESPGLQEGEELEMEETLEGRRRNLPEAASGQSQLNEKAIREDLVFRAVSGNFFFKVISN